MPAAADDDDLFLSFSFSAASICLSDDCSSICEQKTVSKPHHAARSNSRPSSNMQSRIETQRAAQASKPWGSHPQAWCAHLWVLQELKRVACCERCRVEAEHSAMRVVRVRHVLLEVHHLLDCSAGRVGRQAGSRQVGSRHSTHTSEEFKKHESQHEATLCQWADLSIAQSKIES